MAIKPDYMAGTITVAADGTVVTGVGSQWVSADIQPGDTLKVKNLDAVIATVTSNTQITLAEPWTGGALSASPYRIRYQPDGSRFTAALRDLVTAIGGGSLAALQAITGAVDKLPYFTGANTMALADFGANARATLAAAKAWTTSLFGLTMAADKFPYGTGANTMALADITAAGRASLNITGTPAADKLPYLTGASAAALADLTTYARGLLDDANASAAQTTLGISTFIKALLDDTDGGAALTSLGITKNLIGNGGWYRFPSGIMVQWGSTFNASSDFATAFPVAFPTACIGVYQNTNFNTASTNAYVINTSNVSASTFDTRARAISNGGLVAAQANLPFFWLAIGY
ncbi:hypothetical protein QFZ34_002043 [Phyllobacterium ifriqiyense]|uniref:Putative tail fiber protein gp53-like C-terminal domain-containing protein n=1 Tax=Phyllobacterium ifriqiyense TaxID=314238 RepID=A0ABU0S8Q7_9HYPH|nr:hypothetical protein [Phyllobacterium ifriqiyense]MDQ0996861.1 hypothetical protein [Phyllobacterium ifriqiyense]